MQQTKQVNRKKTKIYYEFLVKLNERLSAHKEELTDLCRINNDIKHEELIVMRIAEDIGLFEFSRN
jgi:hypothetical protein